MITDVERKTFSTLTIGVAGSSKTLLLIAQSEKQHIPEDSDLSMETALLAVPNGLSSKSANSITWMSLSLNLTFGCAHRGIFMWLELQSRVQQMQFRVT